MKGFLFCILLSTVRGLPSKNDLTEKEFEKKFHKHYENPEDEAKAAAELAKEEAEIGTVVDKTTFTYIISLNLNVGNVSKESYMYVSHI